jgi:hypothetical protein
MAKIDSLWLRAGFSIILIAGLLNMPVPAFSQEDPNIQNLITNGGFEEGFPEEFGAGYGWGAFSNGNATVGWQSDTWDKVVVAGQNAQLIEIKNATERNRYAGIYQTVSVVPGQQYKLTIKGLIRSEEGEIELSDYGYRVQYAIDYDGNTAWELIPDNEWVEIPWDEQAINDTADSAYRFDTFEATVTAKNDRLSLFIRGWKKWVNDGSGLFNFDEITLVGPVPENFETADAQVTSVSEAATAGGTELVTTEPSVQVSEHDGDLNLEGTDTDAETTLETDSSSEAEAGPEVDSSTEAEVVPETDSAADTELAPEPDSSSETETMPETGSSIDTETSPQPEASQLPVAGRGDDDSIIFITMSGATLLIVLVVGALAATWRQRNPTE